MKFDPAIESKREMYFRMIECIVPRPIAWVGSGSRTGVFNLAPYSFFTGVSSSPPTLLFCAGNRRGGALKDSVKNIIETEEFTVNIVSKPQVEAMVQTSGEYPPEISEFHAAGLTPVGSDLVSAPRVDGAPISFECTLHDLVELADDGGRVNARIVIGRIRLLHIADELLDNAGRVDPTRLSPVARIGGQDYAELGQVFTIKRPTV
ncbi:MAG: flavin reductase family protein [Myxococcota bacterium]|nr:flavin reductase family protein [Myxococcota bacterium]